ncbi:MAG: hypothetical protein LBM08_04300 [Dysgonamonadaceae bacterium]|jgi:hypothetical protein|nr:hypothetical protein [Dysgonamonadaceae bacterium]
MKSHLVLFVSILFGNSMVFAQELVNPDFEYEAAGTAFNGSTVVRNTPYGWQQTGTVAGNSFGINFKDASNFNATGYCWYSVNQSPFAMPAGFELYQTIEGLPAGDYIVRCRLATMTGLMTNVRLFANNNVQYYGKETDYVSNLTAGEVNTFAGWTGATNMNSPTLQEMSVTVSITEGEALKFGIRSSNMKSDGSTPNGSNASNVLGAFKVDYFRLESKSTTATQEQIDAYEAALANALNSKTELLSLSSGLDALKASGTTDYGKFDATLIDIVKDAGDVYTSGLYTTANSASDVVDATTELSKASGLEHNFYIGNGATLTTGWYKVRTIDNKYLTLDNGIKFLDEIADSESQIWYINCILNNNNSRFAFYSLDDLKKGTKTGRFIEGSTSSPKFVGLCPSGDIEEKTSYIVKSGGSGDPTITGISSDGAISYGNLTAKNLQYRIIIESLSLGGTAQLADEEYKISFNGNEIASAYEVINNEIKINGTVYPITKYGDMYAIGNKTLGYLISDALTPETSDELIDAMPRPCFTFTKKTETTTGNEHLKPEYNEHLKPKYYNLQGLKVTQPSSGIYIVKTDAKVVKVIAK